MHDSLGSSAVDGLKEVPHMSRYLRNVCLLVATGLLVSLTAWGESGGAGSPFEPAKVESVHGLRDVDADARKADILRVVGCRVLQGYPDGTFRPSQHVTEGEFAKVLDRMVVASPQMRPIPFTAGNADSPVTRARAIVFLMRGLADDRLIESVSDPLTVLRKCEDRGSIPEWALKHCAYAVDRGYLGEDGRIRPLDGITRSELAGIVARGLPSGEGARTGRESYTGLLVDCTGLEMHRSRCPKVVAEDGRLVYPSMAHIPSPDYVERHGMASYTDGDCDQKRVGARPLLVKALGVTGPARDVAVISNSDRDLIVTHERASGFLARWCVGFRIGGREPVQQASTSEPK